MKMGTSGRVVGRYIASQGPLSHTVADMWRMVSDCNVHLIVMLTSETEGRRVKCHRYWPQCGHKAMSYDQLSVTCTNEHRASSATIRDLQLTHNTVSYSHIVLFSK